MSSNAEPLHEAVSAPADPMALELTRLECEVLALLASARLRDPVAERRRSALLDEINRAGRAAARRLDVYTRHAVVESHGSHARWNLAGDARAFFDALAAYATLVHRANQELAALVDDDAGTRGADAPRATLRAV